MKQVDFYLISNRLRNGRHKMASRLAEKLRRLGKNALLVTDSAQESEQLSETLWSFKDSAFVAHDVLGANLDLQQMRWNQTQGLKPCLVSDVLSMTPDVLEHSFDVLINLHEEVPVYSHHFDRIAEIVDADDASKALARRRYKTYQGEGFEIRTHEIAL